MTRRQTTVLAALLLAGVLARVWFLAWDDPWGPHHPDEGVLPLESVALWEGVTPKDLGWPASTTRLAMSVMNAAGWAIDAGPAAWRSGGVGGAIDSMASWIGRQYLDRSGLYRRGRLVSLVTGLLLLGAAAWTARRWFGPVAVPWAVGAVALSPVAISHSQYVLADIQGVLFATVMLGCVPAAGTGMLAVMALLAGLAAASKFHFGLWLLTPLAIAWTDRGLAIRRRLVLTGIVIGTCLITVVALVPWVWLNPVLVAKEFAGTVLLGGTSNGAANVPANVVLTVRSLGIAACVGATVGLAIARPRWGQLVPVLLPAAAGLLLIVTRPVVFDRYALLLLPAATVLSAAATHRREGRRLAPGGVGALVAVVVVIAGVDIVSGQRAAAAADVDVSARAWILSHVPRGARVAVHDETVAPLPRSATTLAACEARLASATAYDDKRHLAGLTPGRAGLRAMDAALLNDETFHRYWCRREAAVSNDPGYDVAPYHAEPRFWAAREADILDGFRSGAAGLDVLVMNRPVDVGVPPAQVIETSRGRRVIYRRPVSGMAP